MITVVVIFICLVGFGLVKGLEYFKKQAYIAKVVDGEDTTSNFVRNETQEVIALIRNASSHVIQSHLNNIRRADGQQISYFTGDLNIFKKYSKLMVAPTDTEWEILRLVVRTSFNLI